VKVEPPYGWTLTTPETLPAPARWPADPLQFRARPLRSARLDAELVDLRTGEPIPHFLIGLRQGPTTSQLVLSDEQGRARSELPVLEGRYRVLLIDDERMGRSGGALPQELDFQALDDAQPLQLELPVGPTYLLDLRSPVDLSGKLLNAWLATGEGEVQLTDVLEGSPVRSQPLAGWPWVRFSARWARGLIDGFDEVVLAVTDQARSLHGEARVPASWGLHSTPVRIDLRPTGALEVDVRDPSGRAVQSTEVSISTSKEGRGATIRSGSDGLARFEGLAAGNYLLHVRHIAFDPFDTSVEVTASRAARKKIVLDPARVAGTIEGRVIGGSRVASDRGFAAKARLALSSIDGAERGYQLALEFRLEGEVTVAPFRFEDVPAGEYRLSLSNSDFRAWWPQELVVRPPAAGLEVREMPVGSLAFVHPRVLDASTGEEILPAWMWFRAEGCRPVLRSLDSFPPLTPIDGPCSWAIGAAGYLPRFGDQTELELVDGMLSADVKLERGFGMRLDVTHSGGAPLEGAEVLVDGERAGATDANGNWLLQRTTQPSSLEVRWGAGPPDLRAFDALLAGYPVCALRLEH
jgi:hypothetical protein